MTLNVDVLIRDIRVKVANAERWSSLDRKVLFKPSRNPIKSASLACECGKIGNDFLSSVVKNLSHAQISYTKCISHAEGGSKELCLGYHNRSAVLFDLGKYAPCLLDINRALKMSYCSSDYILWQRLLDRKKRCLTEMTKSLSAGAISGIDEDATNPPIDDREPSWRVNLRSKFDNLLLPNASPKIKLKYNEEWGRHFVATADIKPGEPLMIDDYFAAALLTHNNNTLIYCDFCLIFCDALIPCLECARAMYCSEQCRNRAYDSYHRLECKLSFFFPSYNSEAEAIAIRMFLTGTKQGAELVNLMNTLSIPDLFVENYDFTDKPIASDYLTALRQRSGTFDQTCINESLIKRAVQVVALLRSFEFFESVPVDRLAEAEVFATALLLSNHCGLFVLKFRRYKRELATVKEHDLYHVFLILRYFLNHSCFPNVAVYNVTKKREQIMYAMRPIKKGEQLFISYGVEFVNSPKAERIRQFSTLFTCRCEACSNNWPTYSESGFRSITTLPQLWKRIIKDKVPSVDMRRFSLVIQKTKKIATPLLDDKLIRFRVNEVLQIVAEMISLLHEVMMPMSFCLVQLRGLLLCFVELHYDERERDPTKLNKNLEVVQLPDIVWTILQRRFSTAECLCIQNVETLVEVICRLNFYKNLFT